MKLRPNLEVLSGKLDIAPLIDIMFLLIVFLALSSSFVFHSGLPVSIDLPSVDTEQMYATEKIVVVLTRDGDIYLNDMPVRHGELEKHLTDIAFQSKAITLQRLNRDGGPVPASYAPKVLLRADAGVPYERVVEVMSIARSLSMGVFLATEKKGTP